MLTKEQKTARTTRRHEILTRISGSGQVNPEAAPALAAEIESFEWAAGDAAEQERRRNVIAPLLGSGAVKMGDVLPRATAALAALSKFDE